MRRTTETKTTPSDPLARARSLLANRWILGLIAAVTASLTIVLGSILSPISSVELLRAQLTFSRDAFVAILDGWQTRGLLGHFRDHFDLDLFIYPIAYGLLLASCIAFGLERTKAPHTRDRLILLPFLATFFDLIENLSHLRFLDDPDAITKAAVAMTALVASLKWATLVACFGFVGTSFVKGRGAR